MLRTWVCLFRCWLAAAGETARWSQSSCTRILVDAGISCRETFKRMKAAGDDPHSLSAIVITHEHSDHVHGLLVLARKLKHSGVHDRSDAPGLGARGARRDRRASRHWRGWKSSASGHSFQIGDIAVTPFTIPHDAADPVGFTFRAEGVKVGFATDLGLHAGQRARPSARLRCAGAGIEPRCGDAARGAVSLVGEAAGDEPGGAPFERALSRNSLPATMMGRGLHCVGASLRAE